MAAVTAAAPVRSTRLRLSPARLALYLVLVAGAVAMVFPLLWMIGTSLKELPQTRAYPPIWIPLPPRWENYPQALTAQPFGQYFLNSFIISIGVIVGDLISCSFVAYGFARLRFPGRNLLFMVLVSTLMVPFIVRLVPLFLIFKQLGWINTYLPLIVPSFFGTPFFIFLMRQFFLTIPTELAEAARIDGANEIGIWARIYVPLSGPVMAVVAIMAFQQSWNDFLAPLIFINDKEKFTAALGLVHMLSQSGASTEYWNLLMAAATVMVVPMILLFVFAQRYIIQGVALTGIKG
ncbi:MAG: carbohydrate ABC transporter permease [Chloroflexi bacterium]|nr:carbohydrate ABC transporter permease [Chloroflexota bacterium]